MNVNYFSRLIFRNGGTRGGLSKISFLKDSMSMYTSGSMQILTFSDAPSKEEGEKMFHDQWEWCITSFHFNGRWDYMKDDANFFASGLVIWVEDSLEHPGEWSRCLSSVCEKLIPWVLVQRNSLLAYVLMQGISASRPWRRSLHWHFCNLLMICVNEMLI